MESISLHCPQGHVLQVRLGDAGQKVICPHCDCRAVVQVPAAGDYKAPDASIWETRIWPRHFAAAGKSRQRALVGGAPCGLAVLGPGKRVQAEPESTIQWMEPLVIVRVPARPASAPLGRRVFIACVVACAAAVLVCLLWLIAAMQQSAESASPGPKKHGGGPPGGRVVMSCK